MAILAPTEQLNGRPVLSSNASVELQMEYGRLPFKRTRDEMGFIREAGAGHVLTAGAQ